MRRLPPLNALKAFESSARLMSFTRAGQELSVTHGAISRQIALLESWLGINLFQRSKSHLELTPAGKKFYEEISASLDRIALATQQLVQNQDQADLIVNAPPTFTLRWLIPRLSTFQRQHLGVNVKLTASVGPIDFNRDACAIAIRGADEPVAGMQSRAFLTEKIMPVCHPDILEKNPVATPHDIAKHTLLNYATEPYAWSAWLKAVDASEVTPAGELNFEQMYFTLQAALEGLGMALIPYFLVADDIAAGRLCTPFGQTGVRERQYYAISNPGTQINAGHEAFLAWLEHEGQSTMALCDQLIAEAKDS